MERATLSPAAADAAAERPICLDEWVASHGPLAAHVLVAVALELCARAGRLSGPRLSEVIESLGAVNVVRGVHGGWIWAPRHVGSGGYRIPDAAVIERIGAILFHGLTGEALSHPLEDAQTVRNRLRDRRPDLSGETVDIVLSAVMSSRHAGMTLAGFAGDLRQLLGVKQRLHASRKLRLLQLLGIVVILAAISAWSVASRRAEPIESHGFTTTETALLDALSETAQSFAMMDEHTAALQVYQQMERLKTIRIASGDPRILWQRGHDGWIRSLRGDRLTTEQTLTPAPAVLRATLGERHPYTRAVRLELAATREARGAIDEAAALKDAAARSTRDLVADPTSILPGVPAPPGVIAHVMPNAPELEGFRRARGGGFSVPLTSIQRLLAERGGWRLHLVAGGPCRISFVVGNNPRLLTVSVSRAADRRWSIQVEGIDPPVAFNALADDNLEVALIADANAAVEVRLPNQRFSGAIARATSPPHPPYSLSFDGGQDNSGCTLVWLEIPFPFEPKQ